MQAFSAAEMNRFGTPSLITRNTNDVQQIQLFLQMALTLMVIAPIMCVGGVIMAIEESAALSPLLVVAVPLMGAGDRRACWSLVVPLFRSMQVKIDRINQVLREQITGVRVIRAFVRTGAEQERFGEANADLTATALRVNRIFALAMPALMVILNLSSVAVLWFGGHLVSDGSMPIGNLTAFLTYILADPDVRDDGRDDGDPGARARWPARSASSRCSSTRAVDHRPAAPGRRPPASPGGVEFRDVSVRVSGQRAPGPATT